MRRGRRLVAVVFVIAAVAVTAIILTNVTGIVSVHMGIAPDFHFCAGFWLLGGHEAICRKIRSVSSHVAATQLKIVLCMH
mmetsp:Transcript_36334/g.76473  ORF Transcript_36334/g.76473 Transcript_36334/m.76473 type:complete len:80 (-) Transcript_36334:857-1096(-)